MTVYDLYGRKCEQFENLDAEYSVLLKLLSEVVSGEVAASRILVNLTDRTWVKADEGARPGLPATSNGLPVCVVAPEEAKE